MRIALLIGWRMDVQNGREEEDGEGDGEELGVVCVELDAVDDFDDEREEC